MKKVLVAAALALVANTASAVISGSSHDLTASYGGGAKCAYCHMPHNSPDTSGLAPLWSRNNNTTFSYSVYSSVFGGQKSAQPGVGSRLCLSCHDGTQAVASIYNAAGQLYNIGSNTAKVPAGVALVGTNLTADHPVGITYNTATGNTAGIGTLSNTAFKLFNNMVECPSCHNAHQAKISGSSYPNRAFMANTTADFCSACHSQK